FVGRCLWFVVRGHVAANIMSRGHSPSIATTRAAGPWQRRNARSLLFLDRRRGAVCLDRRDARIARRGGRIHLARADHLAVGRLQVEELLAIRRRLLLVAF